MTTIQTTKEDYTARYGGGVVEILKDGETIADEFADDMAAAIAWVENFDFEAYEDSLPHPYADEPFYHDPYDDGAMS